MALFGKRIKEQAAPCHCEGRDGQNAVEAEAGASVKVLGSGCAKCNALEAAAREALETLRMDTAIEHVTDYSHIAAYGVMTTPALVVDGKVVSTGRVLKPEEIVKLIQKTKGTGGD